VITGKRGVGCLRGVEVAGVAFFEGMLMFFEVAGVALFAGVCLR
jgi:hypothetical protein